MLNAQEAADRYEPRPQDAPKEIFAARLAVCQTCPSREGLACSALPGQQCTIVARQHPRPCPERRWPGDAAKRPAACTPPPSTTAASAPRLGLLARLRSLLTRARNPNAHCPLPNARVSIVIAARNYSRFLEQSIESALSQSVPCEVIYSDDASTDDSVDVARKFADRGVIVLANAVHSGPATARRRGFEIARGDWFCNLDGDDVMPRDYIARMLAATDTQTPFVYGTAAAFGVHSSYWEPPAWGVKSLWDRNFVNTSALYSRVAYHAAGGWRQTATGTMWDWDLALRAARFGTPRRAAAVLQYRQHGDSFSRAYQEVDSEADILPHLEKSRRSLVRLSVGSILSGRLPSLFGDWFDQLARSVRQLRSPYPVDLVLLEHDTPRHFRDLVSFVVARHADTFDTVRILPAGKALTWSTEAARRSAVSTFLAAQCNRLKRELRGDVHLIVEDDVLLPLNGVERLFHALTAGLKIAAGVSGMYRNRHVPEKLVGGWWPANMEQPDELEVGATRPAREAVLNKLREAHPTGIPVNLCGTGCLMYWADSAPDWTSHHRGVAAHDWTWSTAAVARGRRVLLLPDVPCAHASTASELLTLP